MLGFGQASGFDRARSRDPKSAEFIRARPRPAGILGRHRDAASIFLLDHADRNWLRDRRRAGARARRRAGAEPAAGARPGACAGQARPVQDRRHQAAGGGERPELRCIPQATRRDRPEKGSRRARAAGRRELLLGAGRHATSPTRPNPPSTIWPRRIRLDGKDGLGLGGAHRICGRDHRHAGCPAARRVLRAGEPTFDDKAADELANATQTDSADWAIPVHDGVEVRSGPQPDAAVVDKLGLHLVRALDDDSPANAVMATASKVITPSGKIGYVPVETCAPIGRRRSCATSRTRMAGRSPAFSAASRAA